MSRSGGSHGPCAGGQLQFSTLALSRFRGCRLMVPQYAPSPCSAGKRPKRPFRPAAAMAEADRRCATRLPCNGHWSCRSHQYLGSGSNADERKGMGYRSDGLGALRFLPGLFTPDGSSWRCCRPIQPEMGTVHFGRLVVALDGGHSFAPISDRNGDCAGPGGNGPERRHSLHQQHSGALVSAR